MTHDELARKVRQLDLRGRRVAASVVGTAYHAASKGNGIEFVDVREYVPEDDARAIDWRVTARLNRPHVKRFLEEREQTVLLMVDTSPSVQIPRSRQVETRAEICSILAAAACLNRDRIGAIFFSDKVEHYCPPQTGDTPRLRLIRELLAIETKRRGTDISRALGFLCRVQRKRCLVFVISDYLDRSFGQAIRSAARQHDLVAICVVDASEQQLPESGLVQFVDPESHAYWVLDTAHPIVRARFQQAATRRANHLRDLFRNCDVDHLRVTAGTDYFGALIELLRAHARRG